MRDARRNAGQGESRFHLLHITYLLYVFLHESKQLTEQGPRKWQELRDMRVQSCDKRHQQQS